MPGTLAGPGKPLSGKDGRVTVGGVNLTLEFWEVDPEANPISGFSFESQGWDEGIFGKKSARVRLRGYWDADQNPHGSPPRFLAGEIIDNVLLYIAKNTQKHFNFPKFRVQRVPVRNEADGRVDYEVEGMNQGPFHYPAD